MNHIEYKIGVMAAFKSGSEIEYRDAGRINNWMFVPNPAWNWDQYEYRIKLKPENANFKHVKLGTGLAKVTADQVTIESRHYEFSEIRAVYEAMVELRSDEFDRK